MVDIVACVSVGASLVDSGITDDGQQVIASVLRILVENHLHLLCPFDDELLTGLAPSVGEVAIFRVSGFFRGPFSAAIGRGRQGYYRECTWRRCHCKNHPKRNNRIEKICFKFFTINFVVKKQCFNYVKIRKNQA